MAPSSSAGFASFFPTAPRAQRQKATERERERSRASQGSADRDARSPPTSTSLSASRDGIKPDTSSSSDAAHLPTDDNESLQGDILNGVGSASSHASTASSVFSHASAKNAPLHASNSLLTPITNAGSPSNSSKILQKPQHTKQSQDGMRQGDSNSASTADSASISRRTGAASRVPARDPTRQTQGTRRTYDPLLDKKLSSAERKTAKPTYKTFGAVRDLYYNIHMSLEGGRHLTWCNL